MHGRLRFQTLNEPLTLAFYIDSDIKKVDFFRFDYMWDGLLSMYPDGFALEIENAPENIIFLPDKYFKPRASFTVDNKIEKVFLSQSDVDICEIPKIEGEWILNVKVLPKGNINN